MILKDIVSSSGGITEVNSSAEYIGENTDGDIIFSDLTIFRADTSKLEPLNTALVNPYPLFMSGNFLIITDGNIYQVFDSKTNLRYNIANCNGPRAVALSETKILIDDCSNDKVMDISDGTRTPLDTSATNGATGNPNHEWVEVSDGAIFVMQWCVDEAQDYNLCHINQNGELSAISNEEFNPNSLGNPGSINNKNLFVSGNNIIVKELNQISLVQRGNGSKKAILAGYNILGISIKGDKVYFTAEDNLGNAVSGEYVISTDETVTYTTDYEFLSLKAIE